MENVSHGFSSASYSSLIEMIKRNNLFNIELDVSNKQIHELSLHRIYLAHKRKAFLHQTIFIGLSLLFFMLGLMIYFKSTNWIYSLYFGDSEKTKSIAYSFSFLLSIVTFGMGITINPELEAVEHVARQAQENLVEIYQKKYSEYELKGQLIAKKESSSFLIQPHYQKSLKQSQKNREKSLHLLECIAYANTLNNLAKEQLLRNSLTAFQNNLNFLVPCSSSKFET